MVSRERLAELFEDTEKLILEGRFDEALQLARGIERSQFEIADRLKCEILESKCLTKLGKCEEALEITRQVAEEGKRTSGYSKIVVDALIIMAESLWRLGRLDESLETIEEGEQMYQTLTFHTLAYHILARSEILQRPALLYHKGVVYRLQGDLDQALENYEQSLALYEESGNRQGIAEALNGLGTVFNLKGDRDRALDFYERSLVLKEEIGNKLDIAKSFNNIGLTYESQGELDRALEYYQRSLTLLEEIGHMYVFAVVLLNIGLVYYSRGELDLALECYQKILTLFEEFGNKQHIAQILHNIGEVYFRKGDLGQALEYYKRSLALREEIGNKLDLSDILFGLVTITIDKHAINQAKHYLQRLEHINEQEENKLIDQRCRVAEALVLKTSMRVRNRAKAEELLEQVVDEEIVFHQVTVIALLNLCDILLVELRLSGDVEVLRGVQTHLSKLLKIATEQHSHWLLAETYVLQSKLALLNLNVRGARHLLTEAQRIADEKGLGQLAMKISSEHDTLLNELDLWEELSKREAPLAERTKLARIDTHLERMFQQSPVEVPNLPEEEKVMFMILGQGGLVVFSKTFIYATEVDEILTGGFLNALQSFSDEAFSETLDRIKIGTYTILVKTKDPLTICYVFKGQSYSAQQKLSRFIEVAPQMSSVWNPVLETAMSGRTLNIAAQSSLESLLTEVFAG